MAASENINKICRIDSIEELTEELQIIIRNWGFERFAYLCSPKNSRDATESDPPIMVSNFPVEWIAHYRRESLYCTDPIFAVARNNRDVFSWTAEGLESCPTPEWHRFIQKTNRFPVNRGVTAPIHGPRSELAVFTLDTSNIQEAPERLVEQIGPELFLTAQYTHNTVRNKFLNISANEKTRLTARQEECLYWTAQGKTSWEVSNIVGISEATANFHLKNAVVKLDASNKCHAVSKAISHGILQL